MREREDSGVLALAHSLALTLSSDCPFHCHIDYTRWWWWWVPAPSLVALQLLTEHSASVSAAVFLCLSLFCSVFQASSHTLFK